MALSAGTRLGLYEIVSPLGAGGMGEVYRARDTRLGREVAVKIMPESGPADRLRRFEQEAQLLAALNHPNIGALYGVEESTGGLALVMELVEGQTLAERIKQGPIPVEEALPIAGQIAEALEYAHERGIVHRDLKPANVKLLPDGKVKVLDFGLAKALETERGSSSILSSPTLTGAATKMGVILGTAAYMSPEQAKGKAVDRRSDVWSFGCVLFEMLTGQLAFSGDTVTDTMAAIVRGEPEWNALPPRIPASVRRLLQRCLQKDAKARVQCMGDVRLALEDVGAGEAQPAVIAAASARRGPTFWAALALVAVASALLSVWAWTRLRPAAAAPVMRFSIALPAGQVLAGSGPAISADGRSIAYVAKEADGVARLYVRALDSFEPKVIPDSEGAQQPFFSPDGRKVAFFTKGKLMVASLAGGAPSPIADASYQPFGAAWGEDDSIIYSPALSSGLMRIPSQGGKPQQVTVPDEVGKGYAHVFPEFLPGGKSVLFTVWGGTNLDASGPAVLSLDSGTWTTVNPTIFIGRYARTGYLLVSGMHGVTAAPFDPDRPQPTRAQTFVIEDVLVLPAFGASWIALSNNGTLAYVPGVTNLSTPTWVDQHGAFTASASSAGSFADPEVSPDGTRMVAEGDEALWIVDLRRGTRTRITLDNEGMNAYPIWSRDGKRIIFGSNRSGDWEIYSVSVTGGPAKRLMTRKGTQLPLSEGPDGSILYSERARGTGADLWVLAPDGKETPFLVSPFSKVGGKYSPDGRIIAYASDESGRNEVYVRSVANRDDVVSVSNDGASSPRWSPDGKVLYYRHGDALMAVTVTSGGSLSVGEPRKLFEMKDAAAGRSTNHSGYTVAPDGRFLILRLDPRAIPTQINVVLNWFEELKAKVPTK